MALTFGSADKSFVAELSKKGYDIIIEKQLTSELLESFKETYILTGQMLDRPAFWKHGEGSQSTDCSGEGIVFAYLCISKGKEPALYLERHPTCDYINITNGMRTTRTHDMAKVLGFDDNDLKNLK